jgi:glycosyltransferase involved in cell wall biosynthesis
VVATDADGPGRLSVELGRPFAYAGVPTLFFSRQWSEAFKYSRPLAGWLKANVRSFDLVEIHAVFSHSSLAAAWACRRYGVPYIVRPLGSLAPWSLNQKRLRKFLLWHLGVKQMLHGAAVIHYTTAAERSEAEGALRLGAGVVVPLGIDEETLNAAVAPESFRLQYPALGKDPYVLVLCRLHPKKGLDLFLDVFLDVARREEFQHWRLVVAGEGEQGYAAGLKRLVQDRGGNGRVLFTGWLEGPEKIAALQGAAMLAMPSHQENFGLSVVEALARGVPVLVSTHVNLAEEIRGAGAGWIVSLERHALHQALLEALRSDGERASRGSLGRNFARARFSWSAVAAELAQVYRSVIGRSLRLEL